MESTMNLNVPMFSDLSVDELTVIDGGIGWDNLIRGVCAVAIIVGAVVGCAPLAICATIFVAVYCITRGICG